jgi:hypothetical protein
VYWNVFHYLFIGFIARNRDISLILGVKKDHFLDTILKPHFKKITALNLLVKAIHNHIWVMIKQFGYLLALKVTKWVHCNDNGRNDFGVFFCAIFCVCVEKTMVLTVFSIGTKLVLEGNLEGN